MFDNAAHADRRWSAWSKQPYPTHAAPNRAAFVSEAELQLKYQLANGLAFKLGYEALWLDRVALAPGQIRETYTTSPALLHDSVSARTLGINTGSNVLFQGVTAGLEYSF